MLTLMSRLIYRSYSFNYICRGLSCGSTLNVDIFDKNDMEYMKIAIQSNSGDWSAIIENVIKTPGNVNQNNVDGILLKLMINSGKIVEAKSFVSYLQDSKKELNLGTINGILALYYNISKEKSLSNEEKQFILDTYTELYNKYKLLDSTTCERLLHALCAIDDWKRALKVLEDVHISTCPSHSTYSTLIATLFKSNKDPEAFELIERSLNNRRPLQDNAFAEWINYILRTYKDNITREKHLEDICLLIAKYQSVVSVITAKKISETYAVLGWSAQFTNVVKYNAQCSNCKSILKCLSLNEEEFQKLQQNIKKKLIVGSDLFLNTSPDELKRFLEFVKSTAPYDVVIDALNVSYAGGRVSAGQKIAILEYVVKRLREKNMKTILLLGRKHMLKWSRNSINNILNNTVNFFIDDLSQDDPFFITATILSGPHTDFVSKDLLRQHLHTLQDEELRLLFKRWQWHHQWMVVAVKKGFVKLQPPLQYTPCAQKINGIWHIPYENTTSPFPGHLNDGVPDISWLCLKPNCNTK